eukprot:TRINITY_DN574_c0_g1_i2.p1 TRINITY_DN574_c0_g1~~TRINITY_DN574_c0_g1_i2.p1  ORF type:complete len:191 (+),score=27.42 TRINITY_DN574_c0_g1_i2:76-648(+)
MRLSMSLRLASALCVACVLGDEASEACTDELGCVANLDAGEEGQKVSLLQYARRSGSAPAPPIPDENCEEDGKFAHCFDSDCANGMFERRRRQGNMGNCRRRHGKSSTGATCCGDMMYYPTGASTPSPSPAADACTENGKFAHCWDNDCANAMFERRRRQGNVGNCRRRHGMSSTGAKCCKDMMYYPTNR